MLSTSLSDVGAAKAATAIPQSQTIHPDKLYPPRSMAEILNMSTSWLAKRACVATGRVMSSLDDP